MGTIKILSIFQWKNQILFDTDVSRLKLRNLQFYLLYKKHLFIQFCLDLEDQLLFGFGRLFVLFVFEFLGFFVDFLAFQLFFLLFPSFRLVFKLFYGTFNKISRKTTNFSSQPSIYSRRLRRHSDYIWFGTLSRGFPAFRRRKSPWWARFSAIPADPALSAANLRYVFPGRYLCAAALWKYSPAKKFL